MFYLFIDNAVYGINGETYSCDEKALADHK